MNELIAKLHVLLPILGYPPGSNGSARAVAAVTQLSVFSLMSGTTSRIESGFGVRIRSNAADDDDLEYAP